MLTENQRKYLEKIPQDKTVTVVPYDPNTPSIFEEISKRLTGAGVDLDIRLMGASGLRISGQGDLDIYVLCPTDLQDKYISTIEGVLGVKISNLSIHKWQFVRNGHEVELYLTDPSTQSMQEQIKIFEILQSNSELRSEYEQLKEAASGQPFREYMSRKYEFFNEVLKKRPKEPR